MSKKVALISGGASGMGLAVATALSSRTHEDWELHLLDLNAEAGAKAASTLKNAQFHQTNVTDYPSLVTAFESTYNTSNRLDFVYANAGIVERDNFYEEHSLTGPPPPPPNQLSIDINLKAVVNTAYLALYYFRKSLAQHGKGAQDPVLIMTSSCGGLYPSEFCPMYSAAKAGVVHFNRAIAFSYHLAGIRTYATCPGTIRTNLLSSEEWKSFPEKFVTPMETLVSAVMMLVDGGELRDSTGKTVAKERNFGLTVEVNGGNVYFRDGVDYCDQDMRDMMRNTGMEFQMERIEKGKKEKEGGS